MSTFKWKTYDYVQNRDEDFKTNMLVTYFHYKVVVQNYFNNHCKKVKGYDNKTITGVCQAAVDSLDEVCETLIEKTKDTSYRLYERDVANALSNLDDVFYDPINQLNSDVLAMYYDWRDMRQEDKERRLGKLVRTSHWEGGGFGVKNAIAGAAKAAAMNAATDAFYSGVGVVGNIAASFKDSNTVSKVVKEMKTTLSDILDNAILCLFDEFIIWCL